MGSRNFFILFAFILIPFFLLYGCGGSGSSDSIEETISEYLNFIDPEAGMLTGIVLGEDSGDNTVYNIARSSSEKTKHVITGTGGEVPNVSKIIHKKSVSKGETIELTATATDADSENLVYEWECADGKLEKNIGKTVKWTAPSENGKYTFTLTTKDDKNNEVVVTILVLVGVNKINKKDEDTVLAAEKGNFLGFVKDAETNTYLANTTVSIIKSDGTSLGGIYEVSTDSTGLFAVSNLTVGFYKVRFLLNGYDTYERFVFITKGNTQLNILLTKTGATKYNISGTVKDNFGNVLAGALVSTSPPTERIVTDSEGKYTIANVLPGDYTMTAKKDNYLDDSTLAIVSGADKTVDFVLKQLTAPTADNPANQAPVVTITTYPASVINTNTAAFQWTGTDDGSVTFYCYSLDDSNPQNVVTATITSMTFNDISTGEHSFYIKAMDDKGVYSEIVTKSFTYTPATTPPATPDKFSISGKILDGDSNAIQGAAVSINISGINAATSGADGTFTFTDIPAGTYILTASKTGYTDNTLSVTVADANLTDKNISLSSAPGLIAYWNFDEGSGTTALDSAGSNNGTINGASYVDGVKGTALSFDGSDDYVNYSADFSSFDKSSISLWFNLNSNNDDRIFSYFVNYNNRFSIGMDASGNFQFYMYQNGVAKMNYKPEAIPVNSWVNLIVTMDGTDFKVYKNGSLIGETSLPYCFSNFGGAGNLFLGRYAEGSYNLDGKLDEVKVYNYALSAEDIAAEYENNRPKKLVAYWNFDEGSGTVAADSSENSNTGTITGATWSNDAVKGKCLAFDGTDDMVDTNYIGTNQITVNLWLKLVLGAKGYVIDTAHDDVGAKGICIQEQLNGLGMYLSIFTNGTSIDDYRPGKNWGIYDDWSMMTVCWDGSTGKVYRNGELYFQTTGSGCIDWGNSSLVLGNAYDNLSNQDVNCKIDEVKIYNYALTAEQIQAEYESIRPQDIWVIETTMPSNQSGLGLAAYNNKIYAIGGYTGGSWLTTVRRYDPTAKQWELKSSMTNSRNNLATAVVNGKIYAIGGYSFGTNHSYLEEYNPATDTWVTKMVMPTGRSSAASSVVDDRIYIIGGSTQSGVTNIVEEYNPVTNQWSTKTSMPTPRRGIEGAVINNKIYIIGGHDGNNYSDKVEIYEPENDSWTTGTSMLKAQYEYAMAVVNSKIYIIGGDTADGVCGTVSVYDPLSDSWETKSNIPFEAYTWKGVNANNSIYVMGGYTGTVDKTVYKYIP